MDVTSPRSANRLNQPPALRTFSIGAIRLTHVPDGLVQLHPQRWLPESSPHDWDDPRYLDQSGHLVAGIGALLVEHEDRTLLIDAGIGPVDISADQTIPPLGTLRGGELLTGLERLGHSASTIDTIAFTHLHDDHVGWALRAGADGTPLFARAELAASTAEWRGWGQPLRSANRHDIGDGEEIFPGVTARVTGGHTPGHTCYVITSGDARVIVFGDIMHSPVQLAHPEWRAASDSDPDGAVRIRAALLDELTEPNTWGVGGHFADVVFGRVHRAGGQFRWEPVA